MGPIDENARQEDAAPFRRPRDDPHVKDASGHVIHDASATVDYAALLVEVPQHDNDSSTAQPEEVIRKALRRERIEELLGIGGGVLVLRIRNGVMAGRHELGGWVQTLDDCVVQHLPLLVPGS